VFSHVRSSQPGPRFRSIASYQSRSASIALNNGLPIAEDLGGAYLNGIRLPKVGKP
jgi:hypothetical protein